MICQLSDRLFGGFLLPITKTGELKPMSDKISFFKHSVFLWLAPQKGRWNKNFFFALVATLATFAPDVIMNLMTNSHIILEPLFVFYIFGFMFLLSFCQNILVYSFIILWMLMQTVQLNFMAFFGHPITASEIMNIVYEHRDIFDTAYLKQTWFVMPTIVLFYGMMAFVFYIGSKESVKVRWMFLAVLYLAAHKPYRAFTETKGIWYFQPGPTRASFKNSINTFSYFFFQYLWKSNQSSEVAWQPYRSQNIASDTQNILVIFGESLYSEHMPMFGYARNTFPLLTQRIAKDKNIAVATAIAPGISTATSTALFFNSIREPGNIKEIRNMTGNLFKAAKENGFETYYFSNQESRLIMNIGEKYIDHIANNDSEPLFFSQYRDEGLAKMLEKIDFQQGKKFVVLHMRSPHLPYEKHYHGKEDKFQKFVPDTPDVDRLTYTSNSYDNALLYTDYVINEMIDNFEQGSKGKKHTVFLTADHGQLFDYDGMWGHNNLVIEQGKVPALVIGNTKLKLPQYISSYQFSKLILQQLGTDLINPNEKGNTYFLHGNNIYFPYDYRKYQILKKGSIKDYPIANTKDIGSKSEH